MKDVSKGVPINERVSPDSLNSKVNGENRVITGYAIKFNQRSKKLGNYYESIDKHALDGMDLTDVKCLIDHDYSKILGRTKAGTLALSVDDIGLRFEVELADVTYANDLYQSIERQDVNECSFGFTVDESDRTAQVVSKLVDGSYLRTVKRIKELREISIVTLPAYGNTSAEIKRDYESAIQQHKTNKLQIELELLTI